MTKREVRLKFLEWGDKAMAWIEKGGEVEMYVNDKRPDVMYLVLIGLKPGAKAVELKAMEAGS